MGWINLALQPYTGQLVEAMMVSKGGTSMMLRGS